MPDITISVVPGFEPGGSSDSVDWPASLISLWQKLERTGEATPYQTFLWTRAWQETLGKAAGDRFWPLLITGGDGKVMGLLPLVLGEKHGLRIARFAGGKHANYTMPLFSVGIRDTLQPAALTAALIAVAQSQSVDLFILDHQVVAWNGAPNPFSALPSEPSASSAYSGRLAASGEAHMRTLMSSESRKKLRHKERKLAEEGPVAVVEGKDRATRDRLLDAFFEQKCQRFKAQGIANPFEDPAAQAFFRNDAMAADRPGALRLFGLVRGDETLAVFGGCAHQGRFTGMFTSFDSRPAIARYSPGDLLLYKMVSQLCDEGSSVFDLGTGDASYKGDYCPDAEPLRDVLLPVSLKGQLAASLFQKAKRAKRWLKGQKAAMALIGRLRGASEQVRR